MVLRRSLKVFVMLMMVFSLVIVAACSKSESKKTEDMSMEELGTFFQENGDKAMGKIMSEQGMSKKEIKKAIKEMNDEYKKEGIKITITEKTTFNEMLKQVFEAAMPDMGK